MPEKNFIMCKYVKYVTLGNFRVKPCTGAKIYGFMVKTW